MNSSAADKWVADGAGSSAGSEKSISVRLGSESEAGSEGAPGFIFIVCISPNLVVAVWFAGARIPMSPKEGPLRGGWRRARGCLKR